jgi:hypothetical protein
LRQTHWPDVLATFKALSYVVKSCDNNGIDVYLTSNPTMPASTKKGATTPLFAFLEKAQKSHSPADNNLEKNLGDVLTNVRRRLSSRRTLIRSKHSPKANIFILTDGLWDGRDHKCGIDNPLRSFISSIRGPETNMNRTDISIQFIRFGKDAYAKKWLRYVDNDLGTELEGL